MVFFCTREFELVLIVCVRNSDSFVNSIPHLTQDVTTTTELSEHHETETTVNSCKLPRSQSEKLLVMTKDYYYQEKELKEKYHEIVSARRYNQGSYDRCKTYFSIADFQHVGENDAKFANESTENAASDVGEGNGLCDAAVAVETTRRREIVVEKAQR